MITRRALAGSAVSLSPLVVRRARAADLTPVTIVQSTISFNFVPIYIAQTAGYFKQEGIDLSVVLAGGGPKAMTALIGGGGQFSASVLFDGMMAHRRGLTDVRALATLSLFQNPMAVLNTVAKERGITLDMPLKQRLEAMKGLRIGITTPGATSDMFMRYIFPRERPQPRPRPADHSARRRQRADRRAAGRPCRWLLLLAAGRRDRGRARTDDGGSRPAARIFRSSPA